MQIGAVIKDAPKNSHFNSSLSGKPLEVLVPINLMETITGFNPDTSWNQLRGADLTYVMLPNSLDINWLQTQMDGIYDRHYPLQSRELISRILVYPLIEANLSLWASFNVPAIEIIEALGYLVLLIACINYANLATAQSMGRAREIGLRKTLGAGPTQLLTQFIVESTTITLFAMLLTLASLEIIIPLFNAATGKVLSLDYIVILPWVSFVTIVVGFFSGAYPAYLITQINPIAALREGMRKGKSSAWVRGIMIGVQFTISVFMLALLLVVFAQNKNVVKNSNVFSKDQIYVIDKMDLEEIEDRQEILKNEILTISGVENYSYSSLVPFEDLHDTFKSSRKPDGDINSITMYRMTADKDFLNVYDIPLIAGRALSDEFSLDQYSAERQTLNVMINELAAEQLGFANAQEAIGQVFYRDSDYPYTIVGVVEDKNIYGLQNGIKPFTFINRPEWYRHASIKLSNNTTQQTIIDIEKAWKRIIPEYPIQARLLDDWFQESYILFDLSAKTLTSFAIFSLVLALIGLFGLSAFMAEQRTKEIGIRKVLGATSHQIIKLLIWQFSKPVLWATPFALALAYLASNTYLEFFEERIGLPYGLLLVAGLCGLMLSWLTVAMHAYNVARTNPINALHYE